MGQWLNGSLGDLIELKRGYDLPQQSRRSGNVPIVSSSGVSDYHAEAMVPGPGVVTGRYGTIGNVYFIRDSYWPLNTTLYVKDFKGNDPRFVSYFLRGVDFLAYSDKAAVPGLNRNHLHTAPIRYPRDRDEQIALSSVLGALDDKIELNRRMNETLEAMARAIFKDWFVDFGPTRAKMAMRGEDPQKEGVSRAPYLARDIWSLFPDRLDDEGKPEGWGHYSLSGLSTQHTASVTPSNVPDEIFEHFSLPAFDAGKSPNLDRGDSIRSNKTLIPEGAILLSKLNPEIERVWIPEQYIGSRQICSTEFLVFTPKTHSSQSLLFGLFNEPSFRAVLQSMVTGTSKSHQRISPPALLNRLVLLGSPPLFAQYQQQATPLLERTLANRAESRTLAATRDFLLPKLMSGEIRVRDAERVVEDQL